MRDAKSNHTSFKGDADNCQHDTQTYCSNAYCSCLPSHFFCQPLRRKRGLSIAPLMNRSQHVNASNTGRCVSALNKSEKRARETFSLTIARICRCSVHFCRTTSSTPLRNFSCSAQVDRKVWSSNPGRSQEAIMNLLLFASTLHSSRSSGTRRRKSDLVPVKIKINSCFPKAQTTAGPMVTRTLAVWCTSDSISGTAPPSHSHE